MAGRIDTATARARLTARPEPYWAKIEKGAFFGRELPDAEGTWIAHWRDYEGRQHYRALGHHAPYDTAVTTARQWFAQCEGATANATVVSQG